MSRCFPYLPLKHLSNGARGEAVSESIKLRRNLKETIPEHDKKKKKEKKDKYGKEKKEMGSLPTYKRLEKNLLNGEEEAEKSSLTEEHGQPAHSHNLCYLSDSTRTSKKRKGDDLVCTATNATKTHGNVIRIRLPLQKHRDSKSYSNGEQLCSTSGRADFLAEHKQFITTISRQEQCDRISSNTVGEPPSLVPIIPTCDANLEEKKSSHRPSKAERKEKKLRKAEAFYKTLFENWDVPALNYDQHNFEDQEWLFDAKKQENQGEKKLKIGHKDEPCNGSLNLWPNARYMHQADIYALPYTIPF